MNEQEQLEALYLGYDPEQAQEAAERYGMHEEGEP